MAADAGKAESVSLCLFMEVKNLEVVKDLNHHGNTVSGGRCVGGTI